ncbi:hypothetical protein FA13DRAFT_1726271 [Coprinellus micaceus]|uniref:Uncharacterized protein n=1 Tax=Coprinellus micaceus TaxID=71717 RepID=A0A4Y7TSI5_COPMI|nr:hypothetical protein FA13DRAFT_1726271 [Coprinellus micaceus]
METDKFPQSSLLMSLLASISPTQNWKIYRLRNLGKPRTSVQEHSADPTRNQGIKRLCITKFYGNWHF